MDHEGSRLFDESLIARRRSRLWAAAAIAVILLLRVVGEVAPGMSRPDLLLLDAWQSVRAPRATNQVALIGVDEKSIRSFGPTPWPRNEYIALVERLSRAGAKVIAFDFTFGHLEREAANSTAFAAAMKAAGNVAFGYEFTRLGDPSPPALPPSPALQANALRANALQSLVAVPPAPELIEPEPVLAEAAAAIGHVRTVESADGRIRVLPLVVQHGDRSFPSLALQIARLYVGAAPEDIRVAPGVVSIGPIDVPVRATGEVLLNWPADGERAFPLHSFLDVVRGDVQDEAFRGKVVIVAGTAAGLDERDFPFASKAPGVLTYAAFVDNVLRADFVREPAWTFVFEWTLLLALCGLAVWLMPRLSTPVLLVGVPLLALVLVGAAAFSYVQLGLWLRVFYPVLALLAPIGLVAGLRLTATEQQTRDVRAEKQENQKLLGLSFQEKGMLDMALATFDKLPVTPDMKLVYVNLGMDYENRGLRDKALLVYKKVAALDPAYENVAARIERLTAAVGGTSYYAPAPVNPTPGVQTAQPLVDNIQPTYAGVPTQAVPGHSGTPLPQAAGAVESEAPTEFSASARTPAPAVPSPLPSVRRTGAGQVVPTPMGASINPAAVSMGGMTTGPGGGPLPPGARIARYEIERHLGRGGMGDVYLVRDTVINRKAALKTIRDDSNLDSAQVIELRQRFYREGQTAGQLTHPNIVTVYDLGEALGMSYIVMEFVEGNTLAQLIKKQRLSLAQIKHVIWHAALGLDHAHTNGVFHRDVKPDNIMVSKSGAVKVMDFGIARLVESNLTQTGSLMGTPAYMSPEQVNGEKIDARSDVFSLGVILYELLTGKKPFAGETVSQLMFSILRNVPDRPTASDPKLSPAWDAIVSKALAKSRDERYASAKDLANAVKDAK